MGAGAFLEPLVVVTLLFGGAWINRDKSYELRFGSPRHQRSKAGDAGDVENLPGSPGSFESGDPLISSSHPSSPSLLAVDTIPAWRERELRILGWKTTVRTPNSRQFKNRWFSRVLRKLPFLQENFYWALLYWVYQLGRAFTALTLDEGTVDVARRHALQLIHLEKALHIFWELPIQRFFMQHENLMHWIDYIYSFIHIPGTILFLVYLYYHTTTLNRFDRRPSLPYGEIDHSSPAGPALYEARRRTMATCNLLAFIVFTFWPCMPPRLLSDPNVEGAVGDEARSYGFVDTVHGNGGEGSVWTQNKFCNQYAAMPSLHFGYSLLIGLTVATIPLAPKQPIISTLSLKGTRISMPLPSWNRVVCVAVGFAYPFTILVAIIATANHFILDAVAGAIVCGIAWNCNDILVNLLPLEDWFMWVIRCHFTEKGRAREHGEWEANGNEKVGR